jgi:hypothetical protein
MSFVGKWMEPEIIMLSEINQTRKDKYHMFSLICGRETPREKMDINIKRGTVSGGNWWGKGKRGRRGI